MSTTFPERMHQQALNTNTRRAERALEELAFEVSVLKRRLGAGTAEPEDARKAAELITTITGHLGALGILRETRDRLLALFGTARSRVGGEFAEALLQVMLVVNRWEGEAMASGNPPAMIGVETACGEIITAIETGLGMNA